MAAGGWWLLGNGVEGMNGLNGRHLGPWNQFGLTGFLASQLIAAYWMLPLAINRAVVLPSVDALKFVSLIACGAMLKMSIERAPAVLQLFFVGYAVSMLISVGAFLATTDRRLCNAYALDSQLNAGGGVMALGITLGGAWAWRLFRGARSSGHLMPR